MTSQEINAIQGTTDQQVEALERFVLDNNSDLARLEELTSQFNIFEALGIVRQEIRHSNFLASLMDPSQAHGLGDWFLKAFLTTISVKARKQGIATISPIDVDVWDLSGIEIRREWKNIDIALLDEANKFLCVIENKIHSSEHDNQLCRYRQMAEAEFPEYQRHYVLLNVSGEEPSSAEDRKYYVGVTYVDVCETLERLLKMKESTIGSDVATALSHYVTMIRRRVMPDREIQELCRRIYGKHRAALDLIYEHRPDLQAEIRGALMELINAKPTFVSDVSNKTRIRFLPRSWDRDELKVGQDWTPTGRLLLLEFCNETNSLGLALTLGQGDQGIRRQIYDAARMAGDPFTPPQEELPNKWVVLFWKEILGPADYDTLDFERIRSRVREAWEALESNELPLLENAIDQVFR
jgi:hypothetical protein